MFIQSLLPLQPSPSPPLYLFSAAAARRSADFQSVSPLPLGGASYILYFGVFMRIGGSIPKGLHHAAQGCEERATLGATFLRPINPERVAAQPTTDTPS